MKTRKPSQKPLHEFMAESIEANKVGQRVSPSEAPGSEDRSPRVAAVVHTLPTEALPAQEVLDVVQNKLAHLQDSLCTPTPEKLRTEVGKLIDRGLTFRLAQEVFSELLESDEARAYRVKAQSQAREGEFEVDETAIVSVGESGASVEGWFWVTNEVAGLPDVSHAKNATPESSAEVLELVKGGAPLAKAHDLHARHLESDLRALFRKGLTYAQATVAFADRNDSVDQMFIKSAQRIAVHYGVQVDSITITSRGDESGAYVKAWLHLSGPAVTEEDLDDFERGYLEAALWSSVDDGGEPLDDNYEIEDLHPGSLLKARLECEDFREQAGLLLRKHRVIDKQAGHDFWLTRNHHGTGFWDRGLDEDGKKLTKIAHGAGSANLQVGTDEKGKTALFLE